MKKRHDYYARAIGQLGRSLRSIDKFEAAFDPSTLETKCLRESREAVKAAMSRLNFCNHLADRREGGPDDDSTEAIHETDMPDDETGE